METINITKSLSGIVRNMMHRELAIRQHKLGPGAPNSDFIYNVIPNNNLPLIDNYFTWGVSTWGLGVISGGSSSDPQ